MRGRSLLLLLALGMAFPRAAFALETDGARPGAALVMPYDLTEGHVTFLAAQNTGGTQVSTHWAFWDEDGSLAAEAEICLTAGDSIIVDPSDLRSIDRNNQSVDADRFDLGGRRGFATVTAFAADALCRSLRGTLARIVDDAVTGSYSIAELETDSSYGSSALVLRRAPGGFLALDDGPLLSLDLYTWNPETLTKSQVIVIGLRENAGVRSGEVGPIAGAGGAPRRANVNFLDTRNGGSSLPDVTIDSVLFHDARALAVAGQSEGSGFFRLSGFSPPVGGGTPGSRTAVVGLHGWAFFGFGQMQNGISRFAGVGSASRAFLRPADDLF